MSFQRLNDDLDIIVKLDDEPNDVGGLDADELKAKFDEAGNLIKTYINNVLLAALEASTAAANIGISPIENVEADKLQEALSIINGRVDDAVAGVIPDAGVTTPKLATGAVTEDKIASAAVSGGKIAGGAVTEGKIASNAVTSGKIATGAVTTAKLADKAVTTDKINDFSVGSQQIASQSITSEKVAPNAITTPKIYDGAVTQAKLAANAVSSTYSATIPTNGWTAHTGYSSIEITVNGLLSTDAPVADIDVSSVAAASVEDVQSAFSAVYRMTTAANKLTVYALEVPEMAIPISLLCVRR